MDSTIWQAAIMGLVEGLTEFLPVSSTGHLILLDELLGFQGPPGKVFEIVIQLGAILAVCVAYFGRLWGVLMRAPSDPGARRFIIAILIAFLPAVVLGLALGGFIKAHLLKPEIVAVSLIVGGIVILAVERLALKARTHGVEEIPANLALRIGLCQCVAMIPGVSRSGATIVGSLLMGVDRKTAAEFSFFLAIPTMIGATVYSLGKEWHGLGGNDWTVIAVGTIVAFLAALAVVRLFIGIVSRHGFAPFAWYRIVLGALALGLLIAR